MEIAVESVWMSHQWRPFWIFSRVFSIISLTLVGAPAPGLLLLISGNFFDGIGIRSHPSSEMILRKRDCGEEEIARRLGTDA